MAEALSSGQSLDGWLSSNEADLPVSRDALIGALSNQVVRTCEA